MKAHLPHDDRRRESAELMGVHKGWIYKLKLGTCLSCFPLLSPWHFPSLSNLEGIEKVLTLAGCHGFMIFVIVIPIYTIYIYTITSRKALGVKELMPHCHEPLIFHLDLRRKELHTPQDFAFRGER